MESSPPGDDVFPLSAGIEWRPGTLDAMLGASPDLVYLCDRQGTILYANVAGARRWGLKRNNVLGLNWQQLGAPADVVETLKGQLQSVFESSRSLVGEVELPGTHGDGAGAGVEVWETLLTPIQGDSGPVEVVVVALRDVTRPRRAEQALRESERMYRFLADNATDMITRHDPEGRYLYVSPACRTVVGYEPEELIGRSAYEFIHPEDVHRVSSIHAAILQSTETLTLACRAQRKDGACIWLETTARTVRDPDTGAVIEIHCSTRDISERMKAEALLRESRELLEAILDNSTAVIYVKDRNGRYILINRWYETLFKVSRHEIAGKTDADIFPREQAEALHANDLEVLKAGAPICFEEVVAHEDGPHTYISIKFPIRSPDGALGAVGGISTDITDRKLAEEQLVRKNTMLEEAVHSEKHAHEALKRAEGQLVHAEKLSALGQLVAGVAHEINNPLAFVTSDVTVLRREVGHLRDLLRLCLESSDVLAEHRPELLARIRERADRVDLPFLLENLDSLMDRSNNGLRRIRQIVKDLRDFARLDEADLKEVDLNEGVASTANIIRGRARTKGVEVVTELAPLPKVTCYPGDVNQVILNLLSNAIDACTAGGRVTVSTRPTAGGVEIVVADTGHGIDPSVRGKIFDPFFTTKPVGEGTGLGLSISYGIVQAHDGTIEVDSEPGRGARFTVRLPLMPASAKSASPSRS